MALRAVITAGGRVDAPLAAAMGATRKALAAPRGRAMLDVVLGAVAGAGIADVAVVAPPEVAAHLAGGPARILPAAEDGGANVRAALAAWPGDDLLYLTCDLPYATAAGLRRFLAGAGDAGIAMNCATTAAYAARFPGAPAHAVRLADGPLVNGSAFLVRADAAAPLAAFAARFFAARKSLWRLAALLGPRLAFAYARGGLNVGALEREAARRLAGTSARAVLDGDPGLCFDVDDPADWAYACAHA